MDDLTDLEIRRRMAKIEGVSFSDLDLSLTDYEVEKREKQDFEYSPLTDDALCFRLMVKYKVNITWNPHLNENCTATIDGTSEDLPFPFAIADQNDKSINKAVCLAIIEANKDERVKRATVTLSVLAACVVISLIVWSSLWQ